MSWYRVWNRGRKSGKTVEAAAIEEAVQANEARVAISIEDARVAQGLLTQVSEKLTALNAEREVLAPGKEYHADWAELEDELPICGEELADGDYDWPAPVPETYEDIIPLGSIWKRDPPKKEVVRVGRVWQMGEGEGWSVRATPVRGGKVLICAAGWFLENFTEQTND